MTSVSFRMIALRPAQGSGSWPSGASTNPTETPQFRETAAGPTEIPWTKRHTPVHLLCVLKARKQPVSSVYARELGCWSPSR